MRKGAGDRTLFTPPLESVGVNTRSHLSQGLTSRPGVCSESYPAWLGEGHVDSFPASRGANRPRHQVPACLLLVPTLRSSYGGDTETECAPQACLPLHAPLPSAPWSQLDRVPPSTHPPLPAPSQPGKALAPACHGERERRAISKIKATRMVVSVLSHALEGWVCGVVVVRTMQGTRETGMTATARGHLCCTH